MFPGVCSMMRSLDKKLHMWEEQLRLVSFRRFPICLAHAWSTVFSLQSLRVLVSLCQKWEWDGGSWLRLWRHPGCVLKELRTYSKTPSAQHWAVEKAPWDIWDGRVMAGHGVSLTLMWWGVDKECLARCCIWSKGCWIAGEADMHGQNTVQVAAKSRFSRSFAA